MVRFELTEEKKKKFILWSEAPYRINLIREKKRIYLYIYKCLPKPKSSFPNLNAYVNILFLVQKLWILFILLNYFYYFYPIGGGRGRGGKAVGETRAFLQIVDRDPCQLLFRNNHHLMYIYIYILNMLVDTRKQVWMMINVIEQVYYVSSGMKSSSSSSPTIYLSRTMALCNWVRGMRAREEKLQKKKKRKKRNLNKK